jgi:hypothetical protein
MVDTAWDGVCILILILQSASFEGTDSHRAHIVTVRDLLRKFCSSSSHVTGGDAGPMIGQKKLFIAELIRCSAYSPRTLISAIDSSHHTTLHKHNTQTSDLQSCRKDASAWPTLVHTSPASGCYH